MDEEERRLIADLEQLVQKSQATSREVLAAIAKTAGEQSRATRQALTKYRDRSRVR
jgi:hypothetical protein